MQDKNDNVIHVDFDVTDCVACRAKRDGDPVISVLSIFLVVLRGTDINLMIERLCNHHKDWLTRSYETWPGTER